MDATAAEERRLRLELEEDLQKSAQLGQELLIKNEELEQTVKLLRQQARRSSDARRSGTAPAATAVDVEDAESEEEKPAARRQGPRSKTALVEELLTANQSLEEDLRRLELQRSSASESEDEHTPAETDEKLELQLQAAALTSEMRSLQRKLLDSEEKAARVHALEADLEESRRREEKLKAELRDSEAKRKSLKTSEAVLEAELTKTSKLLEAANARVEEMQQERQEMQQSRCRRRSRIPTACEQVLRTAGTHQSLAAEMEEDEEEEEEDKVEKRGAALALEHLAEFRIEVQSLDAATLLCQTWLKEARSLCGKPEP